MGLNISRPDDATIVIRLDDKFTPEARKAEAGWKATAERMKGHWLVATAAIASATYAVGQAWNLVGKYAQFEEQKSSMDSLAAKYKTSSDNIIASIKEQTKGMVSMADAVDIASGALTKGLSPSMIEGIAHAAEVLSNTTGEAVPQAFAEMAEAIATGRGRMIESKLGAMALEEQYGDLWKTMTEADKVHALYQEAMRRSAVIEAQLGDSGKSLDDKMATLTVSMKDAALMAGEGLARAFFTVKGVFDMVAGAVMYLVGSFGTLQAKVADFLGMKMADEMKLSAEAAMAAAKDLMSKGATEFSTLWKGLSPGPKATGRVSVPGPSGGAPANDDLVKKTAAAIELLYQNSVDASDALEAYGAQMVEAGKKGVLFGKQDELAKRQKVLLEEEYQRNVERSDALAEYEAQLIEEGHAETLELQAAEQANRERLLEEEYQRNVERADYLADLEAQAIEDGQKDSKKAAAAKAKAEQDYQQSMADGLMQVFSFALNFLGNATSGQGGPATPRTFLQGMAPVAGALGGYAIGASLGAGLTMFGTAMGGPIGAMVGMTVGNILGNLIGKKGSQSEGGKFRKGFEGLFSGYGIDVDTEAYKKTWEDLEAQIEGTRQTYLAWASAIVESQKYQDQGAKILADTFGNLNLSMAEQTDIMGSLIAKAQELSEAEGDLQAATLALTDAANMSNEQLAEIWEIGHGALAWKDAMDSFKKRFAEDTEAFFRAEKGSSEWEAAKGRVVEDSKQYIELIRAQEANTDRTADMLKEAGATDEEIQRALLSPTERTAENTMEMVVLLKTIAGQQSHSGYYPSTSASGERFTRVRNDEAIVPPEDWGGIVRGIIKAVGAGGPRQTGRTRGYRDPLAGTVIYQPA